MYPIEFVVTKDSYYVCAIFMAFMLFGYAGQVLVNFFCNRKIKEKWWLFVLLFGAIGFCIGSVGGASFIYSMIDMGKVMLGIFSINTH